MTWAPRIPLTSSCARQPLDALLTGQLDDPATTRLAMHLDSCETCQQRLTQLAAEPTWWLDASRWLEPATPDIDPCVDDLGGGDLDEFDATYPSNEHDLLASGLLAKSDNPAMIGSLGRYEVKRVIGAGGTGIVLQAVDAELNRTVAIKVLAPTLAAHGPARKRFARESQAVAAVAHENVVAVHHVEGGGRVPYLVMQYIDGDSLQERVIRDGPLDATTTLRMTAQLASALTAAHDQGLVHRDVKPANILVGPAGQRVWMTDFGLARAVDDASLTRTGFIAGTPHYMSPEQARGATVRSSSDLFGLGGVVYFMLTGRPPFRAERTLAILNRICTEPHRPVREVNPTVPPAVANLVDRLLRKSADDRFANAEAVRAECLRLLANQTSPDDDTLVVLANEPPTATPPRRRTTTYRVVGATVALILFACCIAVIAKLSGQLFRPIAEHLTASLVTADPAPEEAEGVEAELAMVAAEPPMLAKTTPANYGDHHAGGPIPPPFFAPQFSAPSSANPNPVSEPTPPGTGRNSSRASQSSGSTRPVEEADMAWRTPVSPSVPVNVAPSQDVATQPIFVPGRKSVPAPYATSSRGGIANEPALDDSTIWQLGFNELEQSLLAFSADVTAADHFQAVNDNAADAFDDTVRWMEATARELENGLNVAPELGEPAPPEDEQRLPNDTTNQPQYSLESS